jgi:pimeloyl-ACP methyl ester carboxylesterase
LRPAFVRDPKSVGVYYEPVDMMAADHVRLEGWLAPALDATQILSEGDKALSQRWPAVVLAHGFGMTRQQVLPLFAPLHERGWIVLAIGLRGNGLVAPAGQTFGLDESLDLQAAIDLLRSRQDVDANRIAVVGIGSGANAAVLAADHDANLAALVLDDPAETGEQALAEHLDTNWWPADMLNPLWKWTFDIGYGVDVNDLDLSQYGEVLAARPTLLIHHSADDRRDVTPQRVTQIVNFLASTVKASPAASNPSAAPNSN